MNCTQFYECLDDYADGALSVEVRQQVEQHLEQCQTCRDALKEHQYMLQALRDLPVPQMRAGFSAQALKRASEQHKHHHRSFVKGFGSALVAGLAFWVFTVADI